MSKYEARSLFGVTISFLLSVVIGGPFGLFTFLGVASSFIIMIFLGLVSMSTNYPKPLYFLCMISFCIYNPILIYFSSVKRVDTMVFTFMITMIISLVVQYKNRNLYKNMKEK